MNTEKTQTPVRMRTIKQCCQYFKEQDSMTSISEYYLRQLAKSGKIPIFFTGKKQLLNLDRLLEFLNSNQTEEMNEVKEYGKIRQVDE